MSFFRNDKFFFSSIIANFYSRKKYLSPFNVAPCVKAYINFSTNGKDKQFCPWLFTIKYTLDKFYQP